MLHLALMLTLAGMPALPALPPLPGDEPKPVATPNQPTAIAPTKPAKAAPITEKFTVRQIRDPQQKNMVAMGWQVPKSWHDHSQVLWNYENINRPVAIAATAENPANDEAFSTFPPMLFFQLQPPGNVWRPGKVIGGATFYPVSDPTKTLFEFVKRTRGNMPKVKFVGSQMVPDLPKDLNTQLGQKQVGVGIKISYELQGKPVDEEFYAVFFVNELPPYHGPQGTTIQTDWGVGAIHAFRAPAGTIDVRRNVFIKMARSFKINPAWNARVKATSEYLAAQFNRQIKAGYDQIAASRALSKQISANSDAFLANVDHQMQASRSSDSAAAEPEGRSANDHFDDYIRGVDTVRDDSAGGYSQHDSAQQYHWGDGNGSYRNTNDANYNPSQTESGNWQLLENE